MLIIEMIKRVYYAAAPVTLQVHVYHGSADVAMTEQFFYGVQVGACIEQVGCEGMAKCMSAVTFVFKASLLHGQLYLKLYSSAMHTLTFGLCFNK